MYLVEITGLGRNDISFQKEINEVNYFNLLQLVRPYLVSSDISFTVNGTNGETGFVRAGFRTVGEIKVTEIKNARLQTDVK